MLRWLSAAVRLVHPAPALAVTTLSAALAGILSAQHGALDWARVGLVTLSVAGSQVFTGASNDLADQPRDALLRPEKPLVRGDLSASAALWVAAAGLAMQVAAAARLGWLPLGLGLVATASALAYNLWLSRSPFSFVPYLVSFGILPVWIAVGLGIPAARVASAAVLVAPFAVAAHLANTLRDFEADAATGSLCLAQVLGRTTAHRLAAGLALAVALAVAAGLLLGARPSIGGLAFGAAGLAAVSAGALRPTLLWPAMLVAAVAWTIAWALATG